MNPKNNQNYSRLVHPTHTENVAKLLKGSENKIIHGNMDDIEINGRFIPPIIVEDPDKDSPLMKTEIFGPILPIIPYYKPQDVIATIASNGHPLAVYYYGEPSSVICQRLQEMTKSGAFVTNDCAIHFCSMQLPFGGVGDSGYGQTKGHAGFKGMSNLRSYLIKPNSSFMDFKTRYPMATGRDTRISTLKRMMFVTRYSLDDLFRFVAFVFLISAIVALFYFGILVVNLPFSLNN